MVPNVNVIAFLCNPQVSGVGLRVVSPLSPRLVLVPGEKGEGEGRGERGGERGESCLGGGYGEGGGCLLYSLDLWMSSLYRFLSTLL